ncbi:hypothetical protein [Paenibacillus chitinolyticus]|uniref:hypothetical protein n=1 Tax=Paenibacillus chitinolyticus TaxID=79263 RepID=UPI003661959F
MFKEPEIQKEKYVGFPMKMNAYTHKDLFVMQKDENAFILYFLLGKMSQNYWTWGSFETTVVTLSKQFRIKTKEHDNKKEIRRLLLSMHDKGWIKITFDDDLFEYDTLLTITMVDLDSPHVMDAVWSDNYKHLGWLKVTQEMFDACKGNARHFRAMIYAEWRHGIEYAISGHEWQKVMDISKKTQVNLVKELDVLNLVDKHRGKSYIDENGKPRRETNKYVSVSQKERQEREEAANKEQYPFEHQHNIDVNAQVAWEITDPRTEKTNIFKTGKKDWLTPYCWYVIQDTDCQATKERGLWRLELIEKANPLKYKKLVQDGMREKKSQEERKLQKERESQIIYSDNPNSRYYVDPTWVDYDDEDDEYKVRDNRKQEAERRTGEEASERIIDIDDDISYLDHEDNVLEDWPF